MADNEIGDAQVLRQLYGRKIRLQLELERVLIAIKAFENITDIDPLDAAPYEVEDIVIDDDVKVALLLYNPKDSFEKKIIFILEKIGKGDAKDITDYLLKIDRGIKDVYSIYERISYTASRMYRLNRLFATKNGKRNVYTLNPL